MMNLASLAVQIVIVGFLAWGGMLSLKCLLHDRTWYTQAGL
ncbi:MAG TPA: hypothetical protein VJO54_00540 [Burkholderiales bacterium]|nr:hypothetical protein [Burkholderiales bacterium]